MSRMLFISNYTKRINSFAMASIAAAQSLGIEFYHASNWADAAEGQAASDEQKLGITIKHVPISRTPWEKSNLTAYRELVNYIRQERIDFIHCNTPTGGMLGRLAGKKCGVKKVIYQAHGFHFYRGAPVTNWLIYYPIEKLLARYTDALITINREDYELAKRKLKLRKGGKVYYVPGVGIDPAQFALGDNHRGEKRAELGIPLDAFVIISAGELNTNKNNTVVISAMAKAARKDIHYIVCGVGEKQAELQTQADQSGLHDRVHFLGYRSDVKELYQAADCFVMPSFREGLSRSIMEAMASGLPCIVSEIRGNVDLIDEGKGGCLCKPTDAAAFADRLNLLSGDAALCQRMGQHNLAAVQKFSTAAVCKAMGEIYRETGEMR